MDLFTAIKGRRSIRRYSSRHIPKETVQKIVSAGIEAPTACNRQLWHFIVVDRPYFKEHLRSFCSEIERMHPPVVIFGLYNREYNTEHHANVQSLGAVFQNMALAAYGLGIGSLWMAGYGQEAQIKKHFSIPYEYEIFAALALGYADGKDIAPAKRDFRQSVSFNSFADVPDYPFKWHPRHWSLEQTREYVGYAIYAKSPDPRFYKPYIPGEFSQINSLIPALPGRSLIFNPFAGNFFFQLLEDKKISKPHVVTLNENVNRFLENKRVNMGIEEDIQFGVFDRRIPHSDHYFDNVLCFHQLEPFLDYHTVADELIRVLRPGGTLIVVIANMFSLYYLLWYLKRFTMQSGASLRGPFRPLNPFTIKGAFPGLILQKRQGVTLLPSCMSHATTSGPGALFMKSIYFQFVKGGK